MNLLLSKKPRNLLCILTLSVLLVTSRAFAAFGDIDPTFGTNGSFVFHTLPAGYSGYVVPSIVLRQSDGKIIIVGHVFRNDHTGNPDHNYMTIKRYNENGTIDLTYGNNGTARLVYGYGIPSSAALQADGKLIVGGKHGNFGSVTAPLYIWRFGTDGTWDPDFGTGGRVSVGTSSGTVEQNAAIKTTSNAASQHILYIVGSTIKRLNSKGTINSTFGNSGALTGVGDRFIKKDATAVSDASIVTSHFYPGGGLLILRSFDGNGQSNTIFGPTGMTMSYINFPSPYLRDFIRTPQGKYVTYGSQCMMNCFNYENFITVHSSAGVMEHSKLLPLAINRLTVVRTNPDGTHIFPYDNYFDPNVFEKYTSNLEPQLGSPQPGGCRDILIQPDTKFICVSWGNFVSRYQQ